MDISPPSENLRPNKFIRLTAARVQELASSLYTDLRSNVRGHLFQYWRGPTSANHYEVWLHERLNKIELGIHFEGSLTANRAHYEYLDSHLLEIQASLGPQIWLEDWDHGWVRLYETIPMLPLDEAKVEEVAARLCRIISVVQPLLERASK